MCTKQRFIRNHITGQELLVKCGHCPACLQEKAIARSNRIRNHYCDDIQAAFVTLTYNNNCVPYIKLDDLFNSYSPVVGIYRDYICDYVRIGTNSDGSYRYARMLREYPTFSPITEICLPYNIADKKRYLKNVKQLNGKPRAVGVCYYKDVQDYIKRVRITLNRKGYEFPISYYFCSEYGPTTCRPHYHGLVFFPSGYYDVVKEILSSCWSFDSDDRCRNNISLAVSAASYVSSYVNCSTNVPLFLRECREISPTHSYSKGFGINKAEYKLHSIYEKWLQRDLRCNVSRIVDGVPVVASILVPKYVLSRYFPKIKGYCLLSHDELIEVASRPERLANYALRLSYNSEDYHRNYVMLKHKRDSFQNAGYSINDFALIYSDIWSLRSSNSLIDFYIEQNPYNGLQKYDNIVDFYIDPSISETLFNYIPFNTVFETDFNRFNDIVHRTNELTDMYYKYEKKRKINNIVYSKLSNV